MASKKSGGKKGKRPDLRPARSRYWASGQLVVNKIRHMVKSNGLTVRQAFQLWQSTRTRTKKILIPTQRIRALERKSS